MFQYIKNLFTNETQERLDILEEENTELSLKMNALEKLNKEAFKSISLLASTLDIIQKKVFSTLQEDDTELKQNKLETKLLNRIQMIAIINDKHNLSYDKQEELVDISERIVDYIKDDTYKDLNLIQSKNESNEKEENNLTSNDLHSEEDINKLLDNMLKNRKRGGNSNNKENGLDFNF